MGWLSTVPSMEDGSTCPVLQTGDDCACAWRIMSLLRASSGFLHASTATWSIVLEVLRYDLVTSAASDGLEIEFLRKRDAMIWCCVRVARRKRGRREGLKLSILDLFLCFRVFFLVF